MMLSKIIGILLSIFCFKFSYSQHTKPALFLGNSHSYFNNHKLFDDRAQTVFNELIDDINTTGDTSNISMIYEEKK